MKTEQVSIPNRFASVIIGPRGTKISHIRQTSNAIIRIDDETDDQTDRIITIQGTSAQIEHARELLRTTVKESGLWTEN